MSQWIYDKFSSTSFKQRLWKRKWFWYYIFILTKYVWHCGAVVKDLLARPDEPSSTPGDTDFCYFVLFFFFFLFSFFFNTQSFSLVFLYSYCPPCWSRTFINIYFKLKLGEFYFKSSWSAYWPSLRPEKNISCQDMSLLWNSCIFLSMLVDIRDKQHTVLTPQTVLIYTKNPLAKFKLAICTSS